MDNKPYITFDGLHILGEMGVCFSCKITKKGVQGLLNRQSNLWYSADIFVFIHSRILFWSDVDHRGGSKRRIYKFNFTDSSVSVMESLTTDNPKGLFIDIRRDRYLYKF